MIEVLRVQVHVKDDCVDDRYFRRGSVVINKKDLVLYKVFYGYCTEKKYGTKTINLYTFEEFRYNNVNNFI